MKFNLAVVFAALTVVATVSAVPANVDEPVAEGGKLLTPRRTCCKYAGSGQWCGPTGCCLWRACSVYGGPAQCGYSGCCMRWNC